MCQSKPLEKWESAISAPGYTRQDGVRELNPSWSSTLRILSSLSSPRTAPSPMRGFLCLPPQKLSQHVVQDPAVAVVLHLLGSVEPHSRLELLDRAVLLRGADGDLSAVGEAALDSRGEAGYVDQLVAGQAQGGNGVAVGEFQGGDPHPHQVASV